jgi:hypothetical protein
MSVSIFLCLLLLLATVAAALRTWRRDSLRPYFIAQIVYWFAVILPDMLHLVTKHDWRYACAWVVMTFVILVAGAVFVWDEAKGVRWTLFIATPIVPAVAVWTELYLVSAPTFPQQIAIGTGAFEAWLGASVLTAARSKVAVVLGLLWLAQASYQITFTLRLFVAFPVWVRLNNFLPCLLVVVAFAVIGVMSGRPEPKLQPERI